MPNRIVCLAALFGIVASSASLIASTRPAGAQQYPSKPVQIVIPWAAGGRSDIVSRLFGQYLGKYIDTSVVVINRTGGAGLIGSRAVRESAPDGYTISVGGLGLSIIRHSLKTDLDITDFDWICRIYSTPLVLAVPASSKFKTARELFEYAKANPDQVRHGNTGTGGSTHLASEVLARAVGMKIGQLPSRGEGPMAISLARGELDFSLGLMPTFQSFLDNQIRIIGVAAESRNELFPNVPTLKEQGYDISLPTFEALFLPKGAPQNVIASLSTGCKKALADSEMHSRFSTLGLNAAYMSGPEFESWIKKFDADTKRLMDELGLSYKEAKSG